jgi:hypothetical protein
MLLFGMDGARLGTLERFEIDATGQLTSVVARGSDAVVRRITSAQIHELGLGSVTVHLSLAEFAALPELVTPSLQLDYTDQPRLSA